MNRQLNRQQLIVMAVMGIIAGWLASWVVGVKGGIIGWLIAGIAGSFVGPLLLNAVGWKIGVGNAAADNIIQSAIGAIVVILLARLFL